MVEHVFVIGRGALYHGAAASPRCAHVLLATVGGVVVWGSVSVVEQTPSGKEEEGNPSD